MAGKSKIISLLTVYSMMIGQQAFCQENRSGVLLRRLTQQTQQESQKQQQQKAQSDYEKALKDWQAKLAAALCAGTSPPPKPELKPATQRGNTDTGWITFKNAMGQTNTTSGHMQDYQGNRPVRGTQSGDTWTQRDTVQNHYDPNAQHYYPPTQPAQTLDGNQINQLLQNSRRN